MEGIHSLKPDTTLDRFNPRKKHQKGIPPYLLHMNEVEKELNLKLIQSMDKKISFLKNPRTLQGYHEKIGTLAKDSPFRLTPQSVVFTDYQEGSVYEIPLTVTNVAGVLRRIQVLPPATSNFSISSIKYPKDDHGLIAPGMSAVINVHFVATSLADFEDEFTIISEQNKISVPIKARREAPHLTLVEVLECGTVWVGDRIEMIFRCQNLGGNAGFKFFHEVEEHDADPGDEVLVSGSFTIYPLQFFIGTGQFIDIYVCFQPTHEGLMENKVILACDNQTSEFYTLKGYGAMLDLSVVKIDDKELDPVNNPLSSIWFDPTHPGGVLSRTLTILNSSSLNVPYHWFIFSQSDMAINLEAPTTHYMIEPMQGNLEPAKSQEFKISFKPDLSQPYDEFADLFVEGISHYSIRNIPEALIDNPMLLDGPAGFVAGNGKNPALPYLNFQLHGKGSHCELEFDPPFYKYSTDLFINYSYTCSPVIKNKSSGSVKYSIQYVAERSSKNIECTLSSTSGSLTADTELKLDFNFISKSLGYMIAVFKCIPENGAPIYFQIQGNVKGPQIKIIESICDFGLVRCSTESKFRLHIENISKIPANIAIGLDYQDLKFNTSNRPADKRINIDPSFRTIQPGEQANIMISLQSSRVEIINKILKVDVEYGFPSYITLYADVQKPLIYLSDYEYDLGEISVGIKKSVEGSLRMVNYGNLPAQFQWGEIAEADEMEVIFEPARGIVQPHSSIDISFYTTSYLGGEFDKLLICEIDGIDIPLGINIKGVVKGLNITYQLIEEKITVSNPSIINDMMSSSSSLPPSLYTNSDRQNFLSSMTINPASERQLKTLDFGSININNSKTLKFCIKNCSGLGTTFELKCERYEPLVYDDEVEKKKDLPPVESPVTKSPSTKRIKFSLSTKQSSRSTLAKNNKQKLPPLLSNAHENHNKFYCKEGETFTATKKLEKSQKFYLSNNQGLAFVCNPRKGYLEPYSDTVISVTMYNDICGIYEDVLVSNVKGLKPFRIPIRSRIKGSPLVLAPHQIGVNYKTDPNTLSLGIMPANSSQVTKKLKLYNSGPKEVLIDWKVFDYNELAKRQDDIFKVNIAPSLISSYGDDDVNLLDVRFSVNQPKPTPSLFDITPKEAKIPGRKTYEFTVSFESKDEGKHEAIVIGHPVLLDEAGESNLGEIGLSLQAQTILPWLFIDKVPRADTAYYLTFEGYAIGGPTGNKEFSLTNLTPAILSFTLGVPDGPFMITNVRNSASLYLQDYEGGCVADKVENMKLRRTSSNMPLSNQKHTLSPEDNLQIAVKFLKPSPTDPDAWPMVPVHLIRNELLIQFVSGHTQNLILEGKLWRPKLVLASEQIDELKKLTEQDFGKVNIDHGKKIVIYISNISPVDAKWRLIYVSFPKKQNIGWKTKTTKESENETITDNPDVFIFASNEGVISGPSVPLRLTPQGPALPTAFNRDESKLPFGLQIMFRPKEAVFYKSMYKLQVEGGPDLDFVLKGRGSYHEEHDIKIKPI
jgi:hypothetical protein